MILTDREIKNSLASGLLRIAPMPPPGAFDATTVDLTLDETLRIFRKTAPGLAVAVDPGMPGYQARPLINGVTEPSLFHKMAGTLYPGFLSLVGQRRKSNYEYTDAWRLVSRARAAFRASVSVSTSPRRSFTPGFQTLFNLKSSIMVPCRFGCGPDFQSANWYSN